MKRQTRKLMSLLLTLVMLLGLLPTTAMAEDRIVVSKVVATMECDEPEAGDEVKNAVLTVTEGAPAYFPDTRQGWSKQVGGNWQAVEEGDTFGEGTYRYGAMLRIDGDSGTTHVLPKSQSDLSVTVNSETWKVDSGIRIAARASYVWVYSPEFTLTADGSLALTFHDSSNFDIKTSYVGCEIYSYSVANNVEGGTAPYTFSMVSGPAWISVSDTGEISGTPTAAGENADLVVQVTDSEGAKATITIDVAKTEGNPDDRTKISVVTATSAAGSIRPKYGEKVAEPTFTVTEGLPTTLSTMDWQKKDGEGWISLVENDTFGEGTYHCRAQLQIDSDNGTAYVLEKNGLTLTVDEIPWKVGSVTVDEIGRNVSFVTVVSPEFTVKKPVIVALDVKGIKAPVDGETADTSGITINNEKHVTVTDATKWYKKEKDKDSLVDSWTEMTASDKFEGGKTYDLGIVYVVEEGCTVSDPVEVRHDLVGGGKPVHRASEDGPSMIMITYTVPETYAVTVTTDGNGTASASPAKAAEGTTVTLTATPNEGYELDKWEIVSPTSFTLPANSFTMPANDVIVKASFKEKAAVTTVNTVSIKGITPPVAGGNPVTTGITTDTTGVTLKTIQWNKAGGAIMTSSDKFEAGETYTLYISYEAQSGYEISNTVTVTSDLENSNVNATSARVNIQYTVPEAATTYTVTVTDGTARQVTPVNGEFATTIETKAGNRILLKADDKEGKVFTGWSGLDGITLYGDGTTVEYATLQFIMPEKNVAVTANYIDESADNVIKNINITGITTPLAGANPEVGGITINTEKVSLSRAYWALDGAYFGYDKTFEKGKQYCLYVWVELDEGYSFANDVDITANIDYDRASERDEVVFIYYTVTEDTPAPVTKYAITVTNGTADKATAAKDETVTITAADPETGKQFAGWTTEDGVTFADASAAETTFTMPAKAVTVTATYEPIPVTKYAVEAEANNNAYGTVSGAGEYAYGAEVTVIATAAEGYEFVKWTEDGAQVSTEATYTFTVTEPVALVAVFEAKTPAPEKTTTPEIAYDEDTFTVTVTGNGTVILYVDGVAVEKPYTFEQGEEDVTYTVTATAQEEGKLISDVATLEVTVPAKEVEPPVPTTYTVSVSADPVAGGTVTGAGEYEEGASATVTATAAEGYEFVKWTEDGAQVSTEATYTFTVTESVALVAVFEAKTPVVPVTYTIIFDANGGSVSPASKETGTDGKLDSLPTPTHSGSYSFKNWYTAASGGTKVTTATVFTADTTIYAQWTYTGGGGGGGSYAPVSYAITVVDAENGDVTANTKSAAKGETVTLTVDPDKGYTLETLTVTDKNGKEIELTNKGDGKYTFKMPASKVTVKATFMDDNTMLNFFVDVPADSYYYDAVLWAVKEGITNGTSATTFSPDASCTRAQMVTFLWRAAGSPEPKVTECKFTDVNMDSYYGKAVLWAVENGITNGTSDTTFSPDATCTRAQMAAFLCRMADGKPVSSTNAFTDVKADAYYADSVQWAVENAITNGTGDNKFSPDATCTRAQMVTFLYRYFVK